MNKRLSTPINSFVVQMPDNNKPQEIDPAVWLQRLGDAASDTIHEEYVSIAFKPYDGIDPTKNMDLFSEALYILSCKTEKKLTLITDGGFLDDPDLLDQFLKANKINGGRALDGLMIVRDKINYPVGEGPKHTLRDIINFRKLALPSLVDFTIQVDLPDLLFSPCAVKDSIMEDYEKLDQLLSYTGADINLLFKANYYHAERSAFQWYLTFESTFFTEEKWNNPDDYPSSVYSTKHREFGNRKHLSFNGMSYDINNVLTFRPNGILYVGENTVYDGYAQLEKNYMNDLLGLSTISPSAFKR